MARRFGSVRSANRDSADRGECAASAHTGPKNGFIACFGVLDEGHPDETRAGFDGNTELQRLGRWGSASGAATSAARAADRDQFHSLAVYGDFELVLFTSRAADVDLD